MTKADIVKEICQNTGIEKVTVEKAVEAFMETVKDSLTGGNNVYLRGFGSFIVKIEQRKLHVLFQKTLQLLFLLITFLLLNRPMNLLLRLKKK